MRTNRPPRPITELSHPLRVHGKAFHCGNDPFWVKAVTFGPFPAGHFPDEGMSELGRIRDELGANCLRLFEVPSLDFLHACAQHNLRVFITLPWTQHIDFRAARRAWEEAKLALVETVRSLKGHPAIAGYFVANEIRSDLVRFMGESWTRDRLEELIQLGKSIDPEVLFSYANYPTTEFLIPRNQDFFAMNVYLEEKEAFSHYLQRLLALSGDKPLLLSELGMDSLRNGPERQADTISRSVKDAAQLGAAGVCVFAWSDAWQRGGETIEEWAFGLTTAEGRAKPALAQVSESWGAWQRPADLINTDKLPKISVLVCTYRGSATISACLNSLLALDYPDFEIIVVNDGDDARVAEIVEVEKAVTLIATEHIGLSAARNLAASHAVGEIFVYTDDDCVAEPDWLLHMAEGFAQHEEIAAGGGPNIPPAAASVEQALVQCSPGGPAHVLLTDQRAEHIPGCNLAVRREAFEAVGGFDERFRAAGDDVDFQWRLLAAGYAIGFFAKAWIWHHRRATFAAYRRQQQGYGRAEALLIEKWKERFPALGGAVWNGAVYQSSPFFSSVIYRGEWSSEAFQLATIVGPEAFWSQRLHPLWVVNGGVLILLGIFIPGLFLVGSAALILTLVAAWVLARANLVASGLTGAGPKIHLAKLWAQHGWNRAAVRLKGSRRYIGWRDLWQAHKELFRAFETYPRLGYALRLSQWWGRGDDTQPQTPADRVKAYRQWSQDEQARSSWRPDITGESDLLTAYNLLGIRYRLLSAAEYHAEGMNLLLKIRAEAHPALLWCGLLFSLALPEPGILLASALWSVALASSFIRVLRYRSQLEKFLSKPGKKVASSEE